MSRCFYLFCLSRASRVGFFQHPWAADPAAPNYLTDGLGMKQRPTDNHAEWFLALAFLICALALPTASVGQKLKAEELIARHLESIGPAKARSSPRIISGTSQVIFRTQPAGQAIGRAVLASDGLQYLLGMSFPSPVYPREQWGFNGKSFTATFVTPGVRSVLGNFLMTHDLIFKQGLMSGVRWRQKARRSFAARVPVPAARRIGSENQSLHRAGNVPARAF